MNPLQPSPRLLRRIAAHIPATCDRHVQAWLDALRAVPKPTRTVTFPHTSVVKTYRNGRLCGFEVWRHLDNSRNDPKRRKARLWFGCRRHGGRRRALQLAYYAATTISKMSPRELREWWSEYSAARSSGRSVESLWRDEMREDRVSHEDLEQMSHLYAKAS